jgi:hypothetical protein
MTFKLRAGVSATDVDYGTALLDERRGVYWNLNPSGALILQKLLGGGTRDDAVHALTREYAVNADDARQDVQALVDDLCSAQLVEQRAP